MRRLIYILLFTSSVSLAQDYHLSQYYTAPSFINSSYTGSFDGDIQASIHTRNQWRSLMNKPYVTNMLNLGYKLPYHNKRIASGLTIINDVAGQGSFQTFTARLNLSYNKELFNYHNVAFGGALGLFNKSVDFTTLNLPDQYSPSDGGSFSLPSSEIFANTKLNVMVADFNIGVNYFYFNSKFKTSPYFGFSYFHLSSVNESLLEQNAILPDRVTANIGAETRVTDNYKLKTQFIYMEQQLAEVLLFDIINQIDWNEKRAVLLGISYRNDDAIVGMLGLKNDQWQYGFSYDYTVSGLANYNQGNGAFELSILYNLKFNDNIQTKKGCSIF